MPLLASSLHGLASGVVVAAAIVAAIVLGRDLFIPIALATLLSFVLTPIVRLLTRKRIPHALAVAGVLVVVVAGLVVSSVAFTSEILSLTAELSSYRENVIRKVRALVGGAGPGTMVGKATESLSSISEVVTSELEARRASGATSTITVDTRPAHSGVAEQVLALLSPLAQAGLTLLLTLFMLLGARDVTDRIVKILGTANISSTTAALSDAGDRLSNLLLAQTMLNAAFGCVVAVAMWLLGVPYALLWGVVAFVMRFVPFVGSIIATVPPTLLALAVDPGWGVAVATLAVFLIGEPLLGHIVEPLVLGKRAGLTPFAMVLSVGGWTLLWGPVGLILATPITLMLVVLGQHVPRLQFLSILLGDEPALAPEEQLYHRLLAGDQVAAAAQIEEAADETSLVEAADRIVLPALRLASRDHYLGQLGEGTISEIATQMAGLLPASIGEAKPAAAEPSVRLLVVPARGPIDAIAAGHVADVAGRIACIAAQAVTRATGLMALASAKARDEGDPPTHVLLITVGGMERGHLGYLAQRAASAFPSARILVQGAADPGSRQSGGSAQPIVNSSSLGELLTLLSSLPAPQRELATPPRSTKAAGILPAVEVS